jgi:hypothetical protein
MAKRVSLKGKGADIFFGDYTPASPGADPAAESVVPAADRPAERPAGSSNPLPALDPSLLSSSQDNTPSPTPAGDRQASVQESKRARKQVSGPGARRGAAAPVRPADEGGVVRTPGEVTADVWESLETPATITNSFRYTDEELTALTDVLYQIGKQQGAKLSKQDVARLGLNVILDDYRRRGSASLLGQLAGRRRQIRRSGGA